MIGSGSVTRAFSLALLNFLASLSVMVIYFCNQQYSKFSYFKLMWTLSFPLERRPLSTYYQKFQKIASNKFFLLFGNHLISGIFRNKSPDWFSFISDFISKCLSPSLTQPASSFKILLPNSFPSKIVSYYMINDKVQQAGIMLSIKLLIIPFTLLPHFLPQVLRLSEVDCLCPIGEWMDRHIPCLI